jgi:hypothetical protein
VKLARPVSYGVRDQLLQLVTVTQCCMVPSWAPRFCCFRATVIADSFNHLFGRANLAVTAVSAESGIPTFRGLCGLWRNYRIEEVASELELGSKGAFEQFVHTLAYELAQRQITIDAVSPGLLKRTCARQVSGLWCRDVAIQARRYSARSRGCRGLLAGPEAGWVTGQNVQAGGGVV